MASRYWIKFYIEILDDPKMGRLSDRLWRRASELFLLAGENGDDGALPSFSDMAWRLRLNEAELLKDLQELEDIGIVVFNEHWHVTNFAKRSPTTESRWQRLRRKIFNRDDNTCRYCGATAEHVDHVKPRCQGGNDELDNLVASCAPCNLHKAGRTPQQAGMVLA